MQCSALHCMALGGTGTGTETGAEVDCYRCRPPPRDTKKKKKRPAKSKCVSDVGKGVFTPGVSEQSPNTVCLLHS